MGKKDVRANFRNSVFKRDGNQCVLCKAKAEDVKLDAHHITNRDMMPNGGYVAANGITLCDNGEDGCHYKVEKFYFSEGIKTNFDSPLHPVNLYKIIKSSFDKAIEAANRL